MRRAAPSGATFVSKLGSKKNGMLASVRSGLEEDRDKTTHDTLESYYGDGGRAY